jgi:hypothetical protein
MPKTAQNAINAPAKATAGRKKHDDRGGGHGGAGGNAGQARFGQRIAKHRLHQRAGDGKPGADQHADHEPGQADRPQHQGLARRDLRHVEGAQAMEQRLHKVARRDRHRADRRIGDHRCHQQRQHQPQAPGHGLPHRLRQARFGDRRQVQPGVQGGG